MDAKLEREVDEEGTVDMMVRGEEIGRANDRPSISRRPGRVPVPLQDVTPTVPRHQPEQHHKFMAWEQILRLETLGKGAHINHLPATD